MADKQKKSLFGKWEAFQPTKTMLVWASAGSVAAVLVVGFTWGGWVTGGTAQQTAMAAGAESRAGLAALICAENFRGDPDFVENYAEFSAIDSAFRRRQYIEAGTWAIMPGDTTADRRAATLCAERLMEQA